MNGKLAANLGWLPVAASLLLGCAPATQDAHASLSPFHPADIILVGRFVASEEMGARRPTIGEGLSHVEEAWRAFTFETSGEPGARIRFSGPGTRCPPEPLDARTYVVALRGGYPITTLEVRENGRLASPPSRVVTTLLLIACAPIDPATSDGFVHP